MSQNSKSKRLWECSEPMTHGILTLLILTWRDNDESIKKCCFSSACPRVQFQRYANAPFKSNVDRLIFFGELLSDLIEKLPLATSFSVSVFNMFLFDIWGICVMISSIKVAPIKPKVSEFFRCLLISLRLSDSDKNFLTLRIDSCSALFLFGLFLCSSLTMCLFRLKAELNVLEHSLHRCLSATLTFFSLMKVPKPAADFTFFTWFSLCDDLFSLVFTCLSYPYFDVCLVSHLSQFQDYFTLSGFCLCTCFLCLSTFDLTSLS